MRVWQPCRISLLFTAQCLWAAPSAAKCIFATIVLSADFLPCAEVLIKSIVATGTSHDIIVLLHAELNAPEGKQSLEAIGATVIEVEDVDNPNTLVLYPSFARNYAILRVWQVSALLSQTVDRVVYMDGDMVMTQNSDDLCNEPELSAARDLKGAGERGEHG
eukprot:2344207-Amphidinium_carterae.1